nr:myosin heavy chain, cardiac muscle isoform isoform X1 [Ipomoea batatas]
MEGNLEDNTALHARIQQLERERDDLHKDIEQLCMQQAGPAYLGVATRMHLHRTAALEQEIENLKKKLAACTRENQNLQEELSEAYHVKSQLADLHSAEVSKNIEAEKQLKFFQGCVASAFAERDNAVMEAEKAKEQEESNSRGFYQLQERVEKISCELLEEKALTATLQSDLEKQSSQLEVFREVVNKFYDIRQHALDDIEDTCLEDKCECLLHDSLEMWSFNVDGETSTSTYISSLEEEVETLRSSLDNLRNKLLVGLEIENHLKKKVRDLEKQKILSEEKIMAEISMLRDFHSQHRINITKLLDEGFSELKSDLRMVEEKFRQLDMSSRGNDLISPQVDDVKESECRDVHINTESSAELSTERNDPNLSTTTAMGTSDTSEAFTMALQEKVAALLLLSQEEERHLLERNMNAALHKKLEELQRNLLQVTNEKVKALMELAQLRQEYQLLLQKDDQEIKQGKPHSEIGGKKTVQEGEGRFKNLLKKTYLKRWVGDSEGNDAESYLSSEVNSIGFARMKIENATLRESLESMEHLTSSIRRLRHSLLKVKECIDTRTNNSPESLENIIYEAKLLKTALGTSLPVSWSAESDTRYSTHNKETSDDDRTHTSKDKIDFVSAAGFEMVELLVFVAQLLKENTCRGEEAIVS